MPRNRTKRNPGPDGRANNGGARTGTPGTAYKNRTDLAQPPAAARNQEYGKAGAQLDAQRVVPVSAGPPPPALTPAAGAGGGGPAPGAADFMRPSERPGEPLTTGIAGGPGAGPEALAANNKPDPDLEALRPYLPAFELMASQPNVSPGFRVWLRRLRGSMPPPGQ